MLEKITIKNFQSHKNTIIELHEGITVITGTSDAGKSSIFRAINWLRTNRPVGSAFIRNNSKGNAEISLDIDGTTVKRIKSKTKNSYVLGSESFDVVKTDVPDEITEFLNFADTTIQGQHDPYFLLQDSAGEVAKKLNKIAGFEIIDSVMKDVKSAITENASKTNYTKERIAKLEESIEDYAHLDSVEGHISTLNESLTSYKSRSSLLDSINMTLSNISDTGEAIEDINSWIAIEEDINPILKNVATLEDQQYELKSVEELLVNIGDIQNTVESLSDKAQWEVDVESIGKVINEFIVQSEAFEATTTVLASISRCYNTIKSIDTELEDLEIKLNAIIESNGVCPMCGVKLTGDRIEHMKHL